MENKQKTIYDLELHEEFALNATTRITKVHGGFLYDRFIDQRFEFMTSTFVPYEEHIRDAKPGIEVPQSLIDACENIPEDKSYLWNENEKETD